MQKVRTGFLVSGVCALLFAAACGPTTTKQSTTTNTEGNTSSAPSGQAAAKQKMALVRFINGIPDETITLALGGNPVFSNIQYQAVEPYKEVPTDQKDFGIFPGNPDKNVPPLASTSESLSGGGHYTVVAALDQDAKRKLDVLTDDLSQPQNGKAKVRLINASTRTVDVVAPEQRKSGNNKQHHASGTLNNKADKWFSGVSSNDSKGYQDVNPVNGALYIERSSEESSSGGGSATGGSSANKQKRVSPILEIPVNFEAGKLYTIVLTGGTEKYPLKAIVVEDQLNGAPQGNG